jgi:hypothetical protein
MPKPEPHLNTTVDELADMITRCFVELYERIDTLASKELVDLKHEIRKERIDFFRVLHQDMVTRFDLILNTLRQNDDSRLSKVEEAVQELREQVKK